MYLKKKEKLRFFVDEKKRCKKKKSLRGLHNPVATSV